MGMTIRQCTLDEQARQLANAHYEALKESTLGSAASRLRSEGIVTINRADLEDAYQQGWQGVCQHVRAGKPVSSLAGLLFVAVHRRAIDIYRQKHERRRVDFDLDEHVVEIDLAEDLDDQLRLERLMSGLRDRLNESERRAFALCLLHGYKRAEAADVLGVDRIVFERIMDGATKKLGRVVASLQARGCGGDEWSRALRAYAGGDLSEEGHDFRRVRHHLEEDKCEACSRYVRGLQGLPALFPPATQLSAVGHRIFQALRRLLGSGHTTIRTVAGQATAAVPTAGVGTVGVASGAGVKAALVVAGLAAAGTLSAHAALRHDTATPRRQRVSSNSARAWTDHDQARRVETAIPPVGPVARRSGTPTAAAIGVRHRLVKPAVQTSSQVVGEFGFEASDRSSLGSGRAEVHSAPIARLTAATRIGVTHAAHAVFAAHAVHPAGAASPQADPRVQREFGGDSASTAKSAQPAASDVTSNEAAVQREFGPER
jgi:RNA polymerase sigma factor (sigma-70 family)